MVKIKKKLLESSNAQTGDKCADDNCYIKEISNDKIGECALAFNSLVEALSNAFKSEAEVKHFTSILSSKLKLNELAKEALSKLIDNTHSSGGAIIIEQQGEPIILSSYGINDSEKILESDTLQKAFNNGQRIVFDFPEDIIINGIIANFKPQHMLVEPILYKNVPLGVILLAGANDYDSKVLENMALYDQGIALAFKNAIAHDQLQRLAANDPLTGIYNRRFGLSRLKEEFSRALRTDQPVGIVMFDIDHFKNINDTYGHLFGDKVLIKLTQSVKPVLREGDVFLRYGGEEFLVLLPGAALEDVQQIAERLRHIVADTEISKDAQKIRITISLGCASYPEKNVDDYMQLVHIADSNLYTAKEQGRNRVIV